MFRFGVENLRRLVEIPAVELRPITILVGRNSSGKSTFLRALPLLRQSVTTRTSSPILWFGGWVDFGDFDRAVTANEPDRHVSFSFGLDKVNQSPSYYLDEETGIYHHRPEMFSNVNLKVSIIKSKDGTRVSKINMSESSNDVDFEADVLENLEISGLRVSGVEMIKQLANMKIRISPAAIFPTARLLQSDLPLAVSAVIKRKWDSNPLRKAIGDLISPYLDKRITGDSLGILVDLLFGLDIVSKETISELGQRSQNRSWRKLVAEILKTDKNYLFIKIKQIMMINLFSKILTATAQELTAMISSVLYIGPARAKSDRYYRYQDLAVSEIDPDGNNFPVFLNSLTDAQIHKFSSWVQELFGYGVKVSRDSGHITINLVYDRATINVVDTGYGVSQILPVLGQVWWANNKPPLRTSRISGARPLILAIEQPELHLHPAHQALLADAFVSGVEGARLGKKVREGGTHFILETHSETMINRLGALIAEKKIAADKVQILLFDADAREDDTTNVRQVNFNDDGELVNWPYKFFLPEI